MILLMLIGITYSLYRIWLSSAAFQWTKQKKRICATSLDLDFPRHMSRWFYMFTELRWEVRGDSSFGWFWWNCWPSLSRPSFHNVNGSSKNILLNFKMSSYVYLRKKWDEINIFCRDKKPTAIVLNLLIANNNYDLGVSIMI